MTLLTIICFTLFSIQCIYSTPVILWSNNRNIEFSNECYAGREIKFSKFNNILISLQTHLPGIIIFYVSPEFSLVELTKYADVYSTETESGCLQNVKSSVLNSESSLSIDDVTPSSYSISNDMNNALSRLNQYCFEEVTNIDEFMKVLDGPCPRKAILVKTSYTQSEQTLEDVLSVTDSIIGSFQEVLHIRDLDFVAGLLGNTRTRYSSSERYSRGILSHASTNNSASNSTVLNYIIPVLLNGTNATYILFHTGLITISMSNSTFILNLNNTVLMTKNDTMNETRSFILQVTSNTSVVSYFQFSFPNSSNSSESFPFGYWSIEIYLMNYTNSQNNTQLKFRNNQTQETIYIPNGFSYHCTPEILFQSDDKNVSIRIQNLQVQAYDVQITNNGTNTFLSFSYADDCVGFFTEDIWMGALALFIFFIVLFLAIMATISLATMDRFDNPHDKALVIEVISN